MPDKQRVRIHTASETLIAWVPTGYSVWDAVHQAGIWVLGDCGGNGTCGKCKTRIEGCSSPLSPVEEEKLLLEDKAAGYRLACQCRVMANLDIYLPEIRISALKPGLLVFEKFPGILPAVRSVSRHIPRFDREDPVPLLERIKWAFDDYELDILPSNLNTIADLDRGDGFYVNAGLLDSRIIGIHPSNEGSFFGIALDLGTTTLQCIVVDLINGEVLGVNEITNSQIAAGRDILSRISYSIEHDNGLVSLHEMVLTSVRTMIEELAHSLNIDTGSILEMTVVGNPVMLHLFLGLDVRNMGSSPYIGIFRNAVAFRGDTLNLPMNPGGRIYVMPQVGSFLGADVLACLLAVDTEEHEEFLLIDIGTNGEMLLKKDGTIWGCSVAAGGAFEGACITSGMMAAAGAIDRFWIEEGSLRFSVLGTNNPLGICGSGLIDLLACLLDLEAVDVNGLIHPEKYTGQWRDSVNGIELIIAEGSSTGSGLPIVFNQQDVRQLQLAKAAIRTGVDILLNEAGIKAKDVDKVLMAGAFGNHLNPASLLKIGMLPGLDMANFRNIGNAALRGAVTALINLTKRDKASRLAKTIKRLELAEREDFSRMYIDSINLVSSYE
ncbi:MAG: ASKHA domain-containing protein [Chitinophagales bacterium]